MRAVSQPGKVGDVENCKHPVYDCDSGHPFRAFQRAEKGKYSHRKLFGRSTHQDWNADSRDICGVQEKRGERENQDAPMSYKE
jgi:hypothetical protein